MQQIDGMKPPKEIRTVRRDGDTVTEEYEKMNPDGTITKVITVGDKRTGLKNYTAYKMDRSGIVRKIENPDEIFWPDENVATKKTILESRQRLDNNEEINTAHRNRTVETEIDSENGSKLGLYHDLKDINKAVILTPKQQALIREHKENIMNYGTQKLIKMLNKRLNENKFNESFTLTDEQKDKVIEYGIRKLHKLLEKNLDDERLIYDMMTQNPDFGKVNLSGKDNKQLPRDKPVRFTLSPDDETRNITQEDSSKPISFTMRPEPNLKMNTEEEPTNKKRTVNSGYNTLWDTIMNAVKSRITPGNKQEEESGRNELEEQQSRRHNNFSDSANSEIDKMISTLDISDCEQNDDFKKMKKEVNRIVKENDLYKNSPLNDKQKQHVINFALKHLRDFFERTIKAKEHHESPVKRLKAEPQTKFRVRDFFDEDEIYEYGRKELKKLLRSQEHERLMKGGKPRPKLDVEDYFDYDEIYSYGKKYLKREIKKNMKEDDDELPIHKRPETSDEGEEVHPLVKEFRQVCKDKEEELERKLTEITSKKEQSREQDKQNFKNFVSNLFWKNEKENNLGSTEQHKKSEEQNVDMSNVFDFLKNTINNITTENESPPQSEKVLQTKPQFYRLETEPSPRNDQNKKEENVNTTFDLRSILKNLHQSGTQKAKEQMTKQIEYYDKEPTTYGGHSQINSNVNVSSQQTVQKPQNTDEVLSRIKNNVGQSSSTRRSDSKPYLKERISGLNNIPLPKVVSASPYEHSKVQESEPISFQIKPQEYKNSGKNQESSRTFENHEKSKENGDFQPWWFEGTDGPENFIKKSFVEKPLIESNFIDSPILNSSFQTGGSIFPSSTNNLLQ